MVGTGLVEPLLDAPVAAPGAYPVVLDGTGEASGLADMLHQYLSQNVADSPKKAGQALGLKGEVVFQAAEDEAVCVRIVFEGGRIALRDESAPPAGVPALRADFLSVAHLTTGEEGPFGLLARRKMRVRFSPGQVPFLFRVLRFMQVPEELLEERPAGGAWKWWLLGAGAAAAAGAGAYSWLAGS